MLKKIFAFGAALIFMGTAAFAACGPLGSRAELPAVYEEVNGVKPASILDADNEVIVAALFNALNKEVGQPPEGLMLNTKRISIIFDSRPGTKSILVFYGSDDCGITALAIDPLVMQDVILEAANTVKNGT